MDISISAQEESAVNKLCLQMHFILLLHLVLMAEWKETHDLGNAN